MLARVAAHGTCMARCMEHGDASAGPCCDAMRCVLAHALILASPSRAERLMLLKSNSAARFVQVGYLQHVADPRLSQCSAISLNSCARQQQAGAHARGGVHACR